MRRNALRCRLGSVRLVLAKVLFVSMVALLLSVLLVLLQLPASGRGTTVPSRATRAKCAADIDALKAALA